MNSICSLKFENASCPLIFGPNVCPWVCVTEGGIQGEGRGEKEGEKELEKIRT